MTNPATRSNLAGFPVPVVCPVCHGSLAVDGKRLNCVDCGGEYGFEQGFPNLVVGPRFEDDLPDAELQDEEDRCVDTTRRYWIPLFRKKWANPERPPVILSLGCGVGTEVDELHDGGFDPAGIDCGNRVRLWTRRRYPNRLLLANGLNLPFENQSFDGVFCGCVFPHVGVKGDSFEVQPDYYEQRLRLAAEIARVLKPGGRLFAANPNRLFPLDIFHGRGEGNFRPIWNSRSNPFLLSLSDCRTLFGDAGFAGVAPLPPRNYWRFNRSQKTWKGRVLSVPVRMMFWLNSQSAAPVLRTSIIAPWLVVQATMPGAGIQKG